MLSWLLFPLSGSLKELELCSLSGTYCGSLSSRGEWMMTGFVIQSDDGPDLMYIEPDGDGSASQCQAVTAPLMRRGKVSVVHRMCENAPSLK